MAHSSSSAHSLKVVSCKSLAGLVELKFLAKISNKPIRHLSFRDRPDLNTLVSSNWIGGLDMSRAHAQCVANGALLSVYEVLAKTTTLLSLVLVAQLYEPV